jgi:integral membrane protein
MTSPKKLYGVLAAAEMITWALLILGMALKYVFKVTDAATTIFGGLHGFTFLCYLVTTILVWINQRWSFGRGVVGLASSIIPFATYPFEQNTLKAGQLDKPWRFTDPDEEPADIFEWALSMVIRRPFVSAFVILGILLIVFTLLLMAGPPTQWFS